jgi:hypothetical protein
MRLTVIFFLSIFIIGCQQEAKESTQPENTNTQNIEKQISLPEYEILDEVDQMVGGKYGDILIPSFEPDMNTDSLSKVAFAIMEKEGLDEAAFYSAESAQKASFSSSYQKKNPNALKEGYLGAIREGKFTSSSY